MLHLFCSYIARPRPKLALLALLVMLCCTSWAKAEAEPTSLAIPTLKLSETSAFPIKVGAQMLYLEDPQHVYSIDQLLQTPQAWQAIERQSPNFGFTSSAYWFRFQVQNTTNETQQIYIELPTPILDDVQVYRVRQKHILEQHHVGDNLPFAQRPLIHQNFVMPFTLMPGDNQMMVRIASAGTVEGALLIWSPESFSTASDNDHLVQGIWIGIVGIMVVYNLFLYFFLRDKSYLYYVCFAFSYLMFQVCLKGYGFAYLWQHSLHWNSYAISTFIALSNLSAALLVISFLHLKQNNLVGYRLMSGMAAIGAVLLVLTFILPYSLTVRITSAMTVVSCILSLSLGYFAWFSGDRYAKYFCLAWTCAFGGVGILSAEKFGILTSNFWTANAGQIGVMMLVALLSLALANRFNREKELRLKAQDSSLKNEKHARRAQSQLLNAKENANRELERKVTERTQTLEQALQELEQANKRLEVISTTDALTTIYNRGHFETRLEAEYKRAIRHQHQLSIILCDVDHFKSINDNYGHKVGDECLKLIASIFKNRITRSGDIVARFGGEEFIVLLVDTPMSRAAHIAETLRLEVRNQQFKAGSKAIDLTASFGVAELNNSCLAAAEQIVSHADIALYQAKNSGRDRVICWSDPRKNTHSIEHAKIS